VKEGKGESLKVKGESLKVKGESLKALNYKDLHAKKPGLINPGSGIYR
jgi:hypothetical protein